MITYEVIKLSEGKYRVKRNDGIHKSYFVGTDDMTEFEANRLAKQMIEHEKSGEKITFGPENG